ncbi:MAG: tetratricopeptide repeat protein, partial [Bacteroidia bacterium]
MQKLILKYCFIFFILFSGKLLAQDAEAPKVDTSDAASALLKTGNFKCDSAVVHLKKKDTKGANRFYSDAIKDYKKAFKLNPNTYAVNYLLGKAQTKTKDYKNAVASFDRALAVDPEKGDAFRERAVAEVGLGKDSVAMKDFNKAIDKNYNDVDAYFQLAILQEKFRNLQSAIENYTHAIESDPTFKDGYLSRGKLFLNIKKDYVLALADFNKVIELDPDDNEAYLLRGKTNFNGGAFKNADKDLSRYIDLDP